MGCGKYLELNVDGHLEFELYYTQGRSTGQNMCPQCSSLCFFKQSYHIGCHLCNTNYWNNSFFYHVH